MRSALDLYDIPSRISASTPQQNAQTSQEQKVFNLSSRGLTKVLTCLLEENPTIRIDVLFNGMNAIHIAAKKGHLSIMEVFINYSIEAVLTSKTEDGRTSFLISAQNGHFSLCQLIYDKISWLNSPERSLYPNYISLLQQKDSLGNNALHYAAWFGALPLVQFLIETCHFLPSETNLEQLNVLQIAAAGNFLEILQYLLKLQMNEQNQINNSLTSTMSQSGMNALHRAASYGALETVQYLLQQQQEEEEEHHHLFSINSVSLETHNTALHFAVQHGHESVVQYLVQFPGIDIAVVNDYQLTPLHYACIR
jgi:ankyrin repeat protein